MTAALLLFAAFAAAEVREASTMLPVEAELSQGTLLVFDVDNTLLEPVGNLYSDQWAYYAETAFKRDGLSAEAAEKKLGEIWTEGLKRSKVKPVEATTPSIVEKTQKAGFAVMALTARGPEDAAATRRQFKDAGYDLSRSAPKARHPGYVDGVLFVGDGPDKGKALVAFLSAAKVKPARVVFVDDKPHHAKNVDAALTAAGIPCVAFRYGATDAKVRAFNEVMAEADTAENAEALFHGRLAPAAKP
ncbi:MAG: DUF2608 domain-containing protein [Elusimicrobiota bacterium]|nr:DUF2608 domain-containing protein [Elusimicrobiota bacterium]